MKLIFLLDANIDRILKAANLTKNETEIIKIDDKAFANPSFLLRAMREKKYDNAFFACIDVEYQRFQFFIKLYLALARKTKGGIIDEKGNFIGFSLPRFVFVDSPLFVAEAIASAFVVAFAYFKFPYLKWRLTRKK